VSAYESIYQTTWRVTSHKKAVLRETLLLVHIGPLRSRAVVQAIKHPVLIAEPWVQSRVASSKFLCFFDLSFLIMIPLLLRTQLIAIPPPGVCGSPYLAAHYHNIGLNFGASSLLRNLAGCKEVKNLCLTGPPYSLLHSKLKLNLQHFSKWLVQKSKYITKYRY
jgi:hypothetical protein